MKIPKSITIRGVPYDVGEHDDMPKAFHKITGREIEDLEGFAIYADCAIGLKKTLAPDYKEHVFFHEVAHLIDNFLDADLNEGGVDSLAAMMREIFSQLKN